MHASLLICVFYIILSLGFFIIPVLLKMFEDTSCHTWSDRTVTSFQPCVLKPLMSSIARSVCAPSLILFPSIRSCCTHHGRP